MAHQNRSGGADVERSIGTAILALIGAGQDDPTIGVEAQTLAQRIADQAVAVLPTSDCLVIRARSSDGVDDGRADIIGAAGSWGAGMRGASFALTGTLCDVAISTRNPVESSDPDVAREFGPSQGRGKIGTVRVLPLCTDRVRAPLGCLVALRHDGKGFDEDEQHLINCYGAIAAIVLDQNDSQIQAQAAVRARREMVSFLNLVVHEMRAPLTVVSGYLDILDHESGLDNETCVRIRGVMATKTCELQKLIEDLLVAARVETAAVVADVQSLDLGTLTQAAAARAAPRAELLGAHIAVELPDQPAIAIVDAAQAGHVLDNLVNNALSYGGIKPELKLEVRCGDAPSVLVSDTGVGIPMNMRAAIFERFVRIDDDHNAVAGKVLNHPVGSGLGLHIARQLARASGGDLTLEWSEPGAGSRFRFALPGVHRVSRSAIKEPA